MNKAMGELEKLKARLRGPRGRLPAVQSGGIFPRDLKSMLTVSEPSPGVRWTARKPRRT